MLLCWDPDLIRLLQNFPGSAVKIHSAGIWLLKVSNGNARIVKEIYSELRTKTSEWRHDVVWYLYRWLWIDLTRCPGVSIVEFEQEKYQLDYEPTSFHCMSCNIRTYISTWLLERLGRSWKHVNENMHLHCNINPDVCSEPCSKYTSVIFWKVSQNSMGNKKEWVFTRIHWIFQIAIFQNTFESLPCL